MNDALKAKISQAEQTQVLSYFEELAPAAQAQLSAQLEAIDWADLKEAVDKNIINFSSDAPTEDFCPASYWPLKAENAEQEELYAKAQKLGEEALKAQKVAAFTVAGGQGTRLGYDGPKGTLPVSAIKNKTLFNCFADAILGSQEEFSTIIPWYIMTSPINHDATVASFEANNYFGLDSKNVKFFTQGVMPAFSLEGKMLLQDKDSLALSPNGHGGSLKALIDSGALADMKERGVEQLSYFQVDNALVKIADPLFIGLHIEKASDMSSRSLTKTGPFEKLGNFVMMGDKMTIVEYSDLAEEKALEKDSEGRIKYRAGSPAIHMLRVDFLEQFAESTLKLPYHRASKKVPCLDAAGQKITPEEPNALKLEMFIFDALPLAKNPLILEADRDEQFSAVKNKTGVDSLESMQADSIAKDIRSLKAIGIQVEDGVKVELSLKAYPSAAVLEAKKADFPAVLKAGQDYYFG